MFVERFRQRVATRRLSRATISAVTVACVVVLATSCSAVEDAITSDDETDVAADTTAVDTTAAPVFDPDEYCSLSQQADALNASFDSFDDPVALENFFTDLTGLLNAAVPPPEIQAQFVTLRQAYVDLDAQLAAAQYDAVVLSTSPILSDANVNAAITAVDDHDLELCGPSPSDAPAEEAGGDSGTDDGGDTGDEAANPFAEALATGDFTAMEEVLGTEVGRQAFIEGLTSTSPGVTEEQAGCILDNSDIATLAEMSLDPQNLSDEAVASFLATLEVCEVPLSAFQTE